MRIPENYPQQLSDILDLHVDCELLPSWYCVNFLNIKAEFNRFLNNLELHQARIADFLAAHCPMAITAIFWP
ncbi:hypothetical protein [Thalassomonas actiniarum]|uniref:Uncharacterized protein n=1 Tax=Thalassomonas actiniarum TaxID=485447 RepID=A0AAE9YS49_9GAMM|nr:hypothetical protein [Thalassomonas actiniarum]WDD99269.1 hypothetical protein SG35_000840 [Thalassomonas actiniarum]